MGAKKRHDKLAPMWVKGQSGNPRGGQLHNPEMKMLKNLTKSELVTVGNLIIKNDYKSLLKLAKADDATVLQRMLATVAVRIVQNGDMHALDILLNRLVGKVKDEVMQQMEIRSPQVVVTLPDNSRSAPSIEVEVSQSNTEEDDYGF